MDENFKQLNLKIATKQYELYEQIAKESPTDFTVNAVIRRVLYEDLKSRGLIK